VQDSSHSNKKVILIAAGAIGVTLLFLFTAIFVVNLESNSTKPEIVNDSISPSNPQTDEKPIPSKSASAPDALKTYSNSNFSINYPADWTSEELIFPDGKTGLNIKPSVNTTDSTNVAFLISVDSSSSIDAIRQKQQAYTSLGFKSSSLQVGGVQATKFQGGLGTGDKKLQTTFIFLQKGDTGYIFDYSYGNSSIDLVLENTFGKMISSFKFL